MAEHIKLKDRINEAMVMGIKPCPFCGGKYTVNLSDCSECFLCADEPPCDGCNLKKYLIVCNMDIGGCGAASGLYDTKEEAIKAWNRRCGDDSN